MADPRVLVVLALCVIIAGVVLSQDYGEEIIVEKYSTIESYSFSKSLEYEDQVRGGFAWHKEVTEFQYIVTNTDVFEGKFTLNYVFDNGVETDTKSQRVDILAGEQKAVSIKSPLDGVSTCYLNVVPPTKRVWHEREVIKKLSGWDYLWRLIPFIK